MGTQSAVRPSGAQEAERRTAIEQYIAAFSARDLDRCMEFFTEDAVVHFHTGVFSGKDGIREWHQERFDANLEIVEVGDLSLRADRAILDVVASSSKLQMWKIKRLGGKATFFFEGDLFREVKFAARIYNPLEGW